MPDKAQKKHRTNRVFKSLHKPLTYLGVERTLFYFVCVSAVGAFTRTCSTPASPTSPSRAQASTLRSIQMTLPSLAKG
jgi:hypothetical protein